MRRDSNPQLFYSFSCVTMAEQNPAMCWIRLWAFTTQSIFLSLNIFFVFSHRVFHRFRQAKIDNDGSILSSILFLLLSQLPQKMKLASKMVKINSKYWLANNDQNPWSETHCNIPVFIFYDIIWFYLLLHIFRIVISNTLEISQCCVCGYECYFMF